MPDPITSVVHPSPVRYVRKGGRKAVEGFARLTTPVRIPHVSPGEFEPFGAIPRNLLDDSPYRLHSGEGALWKRLARPQTKAEYAWKFTSEEFLEWVSNGDLPYLHDLEVALAGTPLKSFLFSDAGSRPLDTEEFYAKKELESRGLPDIEANRIIWDDEERSRERLVDFVENDVRIAGEHVYIRELPVLTACLAGDEPERHLEILPQPNPALMYFRVSVPIRPDKLLEALPHAYGRSVQGNSYFGRMASVFPSEALGDRDLQVFATLMSLASQRILNLVDERFDDHPLAEEMRAGLLDDIARARISSMRTEDLEAVILRSQGAVRKFADLVEDVRPLYRTSCDRGRKLGLYAEAYVLPRIRGLSSALDEFEIDAVAGMGM